MTSEAEHERLNQQLSEKCAATVKRYFIESGISASRIETRGDGWQEPLVDNETDQRNRRVEIKVR